MNLRYKGTSDYYELTSNDLKPHGVTNFTKTVWAKGQTQEVNDDAGDKILELLADDFEQVDEDAAPAANDDPDNELDSTTNQFPDLDD